MKIKIDLDGDIDKAITQLQKLQSRIEDFPGYVAMNESDIVQSDYSANGNDILVIAEQSQNFGKITATGDEIGFAEYGTGNQALHADDAPIPTGWGTWSAQEGTGQLIKKGYWYDYDGVKHYGETPAYAMTGAVQHIKETIDDRAREFFN